MPWRDRGQVLSQALDPPDVRDFVYLGRAAALGEHVGVRVQADRMLEQMSEADGKHAGAAAGVPPLESRLQAGLAALLTSSELAAGGR